MDYYINPTVFSSAFVLPSEVADKYLKFSKGEHIKVLIYIMRNSDKNPSIKDIALSTDVSEYDVEEALLYWADAGILVSTAQPKVADSKEKPKAVKKVVKPSRDDVARRGLEDPKLQYLLTQAQLIFGRNLKTNEMQTFAWMYDDLGFDVSVILYIVQYAFQVEKKNIRFIESLATDWVDKGVENISDAEEQVKLLTLTDQAWRLVCLAFGIDKRKPSKKEGDLAFKWVNEWGISFDMLKHAYDTCVDLKSNFSFPYVTKIIDNWYKAGYKTPEDIKPLEKASNSSTVTFDIALYENMLNSED